MKYTFALLAFAFSVAIPASAATEYLLVASFTGTIGSNGTTTGCGTNSELSYTHLNAAEIVSFTFDGTDMLSATSPTTVNKLNLQNFTILKGFDNCSGPLMNLFLSGTPIPKVTIYAMKPPSSSLPGTAPDTSRPYLGITLENVIISQYVLTGSIASNAKPSEQISLRFNEIGITTTNSDTGHTVFLSYDSVTNNFATNLTPDPLVLAPQ